MEDVLAVNSETASLENFFFRDWRSLAVRSIPFVTLDQVATICRNLS